MGVQGCKGCLVGVQGCPGLVGGWWVSRVAQVGVQGWHSRVGTRVVARGLVGVQGWEGWWVSRVAYCTRA